MNLLTNAEALRVLADGGKISKPKWRHTYLHLDKGVIVDEGGDETDFNDFVKDDWIKANTWTCFHLGFSDLTDEQYDIINEHFKLAMRFLEAEGIIAEDITSDSGVV